jgi:hypothetical protein
MKKYITPIILIVLSGVSANISIKNEVCIGAIVSIFIGIMVFGQFWAYLVWDLNDK